MTIRHGTADDTGNWKTYDEESVYTAAVLAEIAKYSQRWAFLTTVGRYIWGGLKDLVFFVPSDPLLEPERIKKLEAENKKRQLILGAKNGEPNIFLGVSSPSLWDSPSPTEQPLWQTAAEKFIPEPGRLMVSKGVPTPPPYTSMIIVSLSEIFDLIKNTHTAETTAEHDSPGIRR